MTDTNFHTIFNGALDREDPGERARYLAEICGADAALRERILNLLDAHEQAGGFLARPDRGPSAFAPGDSVSGNNYVTEKLGDMIGRYKLLQQIGEGGCGVVYMADQEEPVRRRVALKVIKLGMDTKQVIARFEAERQALALMDHPNIAKVLDAGATNSGRPFFVMELVRGLKITEFCDQKRLSARERLELFIPVCQAIQHAHQKGIVHRDLKPSNILITTIDGVAVPKVIDFGIAKATNNQRLTDKTVFTAFDQFIGTPAYMSPEQAELSGVDIDTRTDIYSLGVVLYELLTSKTPFDTGQLLRSGIDEIRRMIRETEPPKPSTRLHTLAQADLTTVAESRQSEAARLISLVRGDLDWVVMKCLEKDRNRRYEAANELASDIEHHLKSEPIAARPPSSIYRFQKLVLRHRFAFAAASAVLAALVLGVIVSTGQAIRATKAEQEERRLRKEAEASANVIANALDRLVVELQSQGKASEAEAAVREWLAIWTNPAKHSDVGSMLDVQAKVLRQQRKMADVENTIREALQLRREYSGDDHPDLAPLLHLLARAFLHQGEFTKAEASARQELALRQKWVGEVHPDLAPPMHLLADILLNQRRPAEAGTMYRESLKHLRNRLPADEPILSVLLAQTATSLLANRRFADAEPLARECLAIRETLIPEDWRTFNAQSLLGACLLGQQNYAEAEPLLLSGYEGMTQREEKIPLVAKARLNEARERVNQLYNAWGNPEKAAEWRKKTISF